ncbi:MAG: hypothetical protein ACLFP0_02415, partial [Rhodosalinus sp.]
MRRRQQEAARPKSLAGATRGPGRGPELWGGRTPSRSNRERQGVDQMNLIAELEAEQIASLGKDIPDFKPG